MEKIRIVNDDGYKALRNIALTDPTLFTSPDPKKLEDQMLKEAGTEAVWGAAMELKADLQSLNAETASGPRNDGAHAKTIRTALSDLTPAAASDGLIWATLNCFHLANYVQVRWQTSNNKNTNPSSFVEDHWLQLSGSDGRKWNAASRLWWMGELANRMEPYSQNSADDLLEAMCTNVQFFHQTLDRTYLAANPKLLAALYDVLLDGNEHLNITKNASAMMKSLNIRAGASALDMMDGEQLRAVIEEAKPPKE